jgi:hypothetical protein
MFQEIGTMGFKLTEILLLHLTMLNELIIQQTQYLIFYFNYVVEWLFGVMCIV